MSFQDNAIFWYGTCAQRDNVEMYLCVDRWTDIGEYDGWKCYRALGPREEFSVLPEQPTHSHSETNIAVNAGESFCFCLLF